jgi:hypothetical protein
MLGPLPDNPIGSWKLSVTGKGQDTEVVAAGTAEPGTEKPIQGQNTRANPTLTGTLPPADRRVNRDLATPGRLGSRPRRTRPPTLSLRHRPIGGREVVEEGFGGPRARRVSHQAVGWVRQRAEAGRCGGEAQVGEDLPDECKGNGNSAADFRRL